MNYICTAAGPSFFWWALALIFCSKKKKISLKSLLKIMKEKVKIVNVYPNF